MGQSIFDWEDEEEKRGVEPPVVLIDQPQEENWEAAPWDPWEELDTKDHPPEVQPAPPPYQPENANETARSGLAWSAGIVFFSSIVFMMFLGWGADLLLQNSAPWGIVAGIILGSIIGFIQFFRITSQIFNSKKSESAMRPLMTRDDDETS